MLIPSKSSEPIRRTVYTVAGSAVTVSLAWTRPLDSMDVLNFNVRHQQAGPYPVRAHHIVQVPRRYENAGTNRARPVQDILAVLPELVSYLGLLGVPYAEAQLGM